MASDSAVVAAVDFYEAAPAASFRRKLHQTYAKTALSLSLPRFIDALIVYNNNGYAAFEKPRRKIACYTDVNFEFYSNQLQRRIFALRVLSWNT